MANSGEHENTSWQLPPDLDPLEQSRARFNMGAQSFAREQANSKAARLIDLTYGSVNDYLSEDANNISIFDAEIEKRNVDATLIQYVLPSLIIYPTALDREPRDSLSILFEATQDALLDDEVPVSEKLNDIEKSDDNDEQVQLAYKAVFGDRDTTYKRGDRLRLSVPVSKKYNYPEKIDESDMPPYVEPEMMVEYTRAGFTQGLRFIIRPDQNAPILDGRPNFNILRYESAADKGKQYIEGEDGELTDGMVLAGLAKVIPDSWAILDKLFKFAADFKIVPQAILSSKTKINL